MKDYRKIYEEWLNNPYFDEKTKEELRGIAGDENEIKERFYMDLEFGTAGLRGIIGAGINRMNIYVVRRATQGLANYIIKQGGAEKAWQSLMTPVICPRNLQRKQLLLWQRMESRHISLNLFVPHRNYHLL